MYFRQLLNDETACASYLLGCKTHGAFAVVDPHVDLVDEYVALAEGQGASIAAVLDTHVQADHVSGLPNLVARTGATAYLPENAGVAFDHHPLRDGGRVERSSPTPPTTTPPHPATASPATHSTQPIRASTTASSPAPASTDRPPRTPSTSFGRTRLLVLGTVHLSARGSGIETDVPTAAIATERDGLLIDWKDYGDPDEAVEAGGLQE